MLASSGVHVLRSIISGVCIWERNVRVKSPAGVFRFFLSCSKFLVVKRRRSAREQ